MRGMTIYNTGKLNVGTWMTGGKEEGGRKGNMLANVWGGTDICKERRKYMEKEGAGGEEKTSRLTRYLRAGSFFPGNLGHILRMKKQGKKEKMEGETTKKAHGGVPCAFYINTLIIHLIR